MKIRPLKKIVVLEKQKKKGEYIKNGIVMMQNEEQNDALVIAVGPEVVGINVGDTVLYSKYTGRMLDQGEVEWIVLQDEEILGIVEE